MNHVRLGATPQANGGTRFEVWAPRAGAVDVVVEDRAPVALAADDTSGTWVGVVDGVGHGDRYRFRLDHGDELADPASGWQPDGVHGPSAVVDPGRFTWTDDGWRGVELADAILYELHVGTFTPDGTLDAAIGELARLAELGVTAVELMPLNAFPGRRNWGYDGVFPSAVQDSYGGPEALARFVDAAHAIGLAVVVDVVYNHLGPEGNVLGQYGPYTTDVYRTPWGDAINVAEEGSDDVRRTFTESACRWIEDFHVDGLRLDAVGFIFDPTAQTFLEEIVAAVHAAGAAAGRTVLVIAESAANDPRVVRGVDAGGFGCDAMWDDDVHHALRVALTGDRRGYYVDYDGVGDLVTAFRHRWVFRGRRSSYRGRRHGRDVDDVAPARFVVFTSNHDHVGNTPDGARPPFDPPARIVAAATVLLSPFTPMLFMGEEYAEPAPFPFFVDHGDPALIDAVRRGRHEEFARAEWTSEVADPADPATFAAAVLDPSRSQRSPHREVLAAYRELIVLRRRHGVVHAADADQTVDRVDDALIVARRTTTARSVLVVNLGAHPVTVDAVGLVVAFDSRDRRWGGESGVELLGGRLALAATTVALLVTP
ncbi:MAG: malto-oligosyltrehalose trehalohydrolase [Ilumatobacteraceae bacterium]